jgi:hypothetical protein
MRHLASLLGELDDVGIVFVSVAEAFDSSTPAGRLQRNMLGSFAEFERDQIRERTSSGRQAVALEGYWPGGPPPFGFKIVPDGRHSRLAIDESEAMVIRKAASLILDEGHSTYTAAATLNALGYHPRLAPRWSYVNLKLVLRDPRYSGRWEYGAPPGSWGKPVAFSENEISIPAILEPIRHEALVAAVMAQSMGPKNYEEHFYLLSKGMLLGACGTPMQGTSKSDRDGRWYRCRNRRPDSLEKCVCGRLHADDTEALVWSEVSRLLSDPAQLIALASEYLEVRSEQIAAEREEGEELSRQIDRLEQARTSRVTAALKVGLDPELLKEAIVEIDRDLALLRRRQQQRAALRHETAATSGRMAQLVAMAERAHERLDALSPAEQRLVLEALEIKVSVLSWDECEVCFGKGRVKGGLLCSTCRATRRVPRLQIEGTWTSALLDRLGGAGNLNAEVPRPRRGRPPHRRPP